MRAHSAIAAFTAAAASLVLGGPLLADPLTKGFDSAFAVLKNRNIFDPLRQPVSTATSATTPTPAVTRTDFAALTGILVTQEKTLAFFSGSRPEFNAVLSPEGQIAGARIKRIAPDFIEVERNGKATAIAIGQTIPLDAASAPAPAPNITATPASTPSTPPAKASAPSTPPASANPSPAGPDRANREALIRRMMEKRQQEFR